MCLTGIPLKAIAIGVVENKKKIEGYRGEGPRTEVPGPHSFVGHPPSPIGVGYFSTMEPSHPSRRKDEMYSTVNRIKG